MPIENLTSLSRRRFLQGAGAAAANTALPGSSIMRLAAAIPAAPIARTVMMTPAQAGSIYSNFVWWLERSGLGRTPATCAEWLLKGTATKYESFSIDQFSKCAAQCLALLKIENIDEVIADHNQKEKYGYPLRVSSIGVPKTKDDLNIFLKSFFDKKITALDLFLEKQRSYTGKPDETFSLAELKIYVGMNGLVGVYNPEFVYGDYRTEIPGRIVHRFSRHDLEFMAEKAFLEEYGFQAGYFPLDPAYKIYLDDIEDHPLNYVRLFKRGWSHISEKKIGAFEALADKMKNLNADEQDALTQLSREVSGLLDVCQEGDCGPVDYPVEISWTMFDDMGKMDFESVIERLRVLKYENEFASEQKRFNEYIKFISKRERQPPEWQKSYYGVFEIHYRAFTEEHRANLVKGVREKLCNLFGQSICLTPDPDENRDKFVLTLQAKGRDLAIVDSWIKKPERMVQDLRL